MRTFTISTLKEIHFYHPLASLSSELAKRVVNRTSDHFTGAGKLINIEN